MSDFENRKDKRRQQISEKYVQKPQVSEEQRFLSKSKKQLKKKIEEIREEELWEDWENEIR